MTDVLDCIHIEPTRGKNILKRVLTTNPSLIESTHSIPGIRGHDSIPLLNINLNLPRNIPPPYKVFKYHKQNWKHIDQELQDLGNKIQNQAPLTDSPRTTLGPLQIQPPGNHEPIPPLQIFFQTVLTPLD